MSIGLALDMVHHESRIVTSVESISRKENESTRLIGLLKEDKRSIIFPRRTALDVPIGISVWGKARR